MGVPDAGGCVLNGCEMETRSVAKYLGSFAVATAVVAATLCGACSDPAAEKRRAELEEDFPEIWSLFSAERQRRLCGIEDLGEFRSAFEESSNEQLYLEDFSIDEEWLPELWDAVQDQC